MTDRSSDTTMPVLGYEDAAESALLPRGKDQFNEPQSRSSYRKIQYIRLLSVFLTGVVLLSIVAGTYSFTRQRTLSADQLDYTNTTRFTTPTKTNNKSHTCGTSAKEARSRNCTFDQLTWAWLPPSCTLYSTSEFMVAESQPWVYWQDPYGRQAIGSSEWQEVLEGERAVFSEKREHLTHCIFMYLTLARLLGADGTYWDTLLDTNHHEHCANMLLKELHKYNGIGVNTRHEHKKDGADSEWDDGGWESINSFIGGAHFDQDCEGKVIHVRGKNRDKDKNVEIGYR